MTGSRLRVMSYNIRHGRGSDDRVDLDRIAAVVASFDPHILALQEVDVGRPRSGGVDQARELAARLGMTAEFAPCIDRNGERYGLATLTRLAVIERRELALPAIPHRRRSQPRRALVTRLAWHPEPPPGARSTTPDRAPWAIEMVNTHLSVVAAERPAQVEMIAGALGSDDVILAGDLNCTPWSRPFQVLCAGLRAATRRARSWPAVVPVFPIDHILYRGPLAVVDAGSWAPAGARRASDHLPVVAVLERQAPRPG